MSTKIIPLGDTILVSMIDDREEVKDGIVIPEVAMEAPQRAKVLALGKGRKCPKCGELIEFSVRKGDIVMLPRYGGTKVTLEGKTYQIIKEEDILGVLE